MTFFSLRYLIVFGKGIMLLLSVMMSWRAYFLCLQKCIPAHLLGEKSRPFSVVHEFIFCTICCNLVCSSVMELQQVRIARSLANTTAFTDCCISLIMLAKATLKSMEFTNNLWGTPLFQNRRRRYYYSTANSKWTFGEELLFDESQMSFKAPFL